MKAEYDALRRVAWLARVHVEGLRLAGGSVPTAVLQQLELALGDLRARFPYTLEPAPAGVEPEVGGARSNASNGDELGRLLGQGVLERTTLERW